MANPNEQIPVRPEKLRRGATLKRLLPLNTALESYAVDKVLEGDRLLADLRGGDAWLPTID